jgi:DNA-binding HxlR family transcriptional regulator
MQNIDFNGLDSAIHGPIRLGVITALQTSGPLDFTTLKRRLAVSDGGLGLHLEKLEQAGYITCRKAFVGKRPRSTYRITAAGRRSLASYLDAMQAIIDSVHDSTGGR